MLILLSINVVDNACFVPLKINHLHLRRRRHRRRYADAGAQRLCVADVNMLNMDIYGRRGDTHFFIS